MLISAVYHIAEKNIRITSLYETVHTLCKEYAVSDDTAADFDVSTTQKDIAFERQKSAAEDEFEGIPIREFTDDYLETLAVYRQIATRMLQFDTVLFHGSVIAVDGKAYLFTAKSGTGKSTHTALWRKLFGERAVMVNDDKPLLHIGTDGVTVYGTPWDGKHRLSTNTAVPLCGICILTRAEENHIERISKTDAYAMLMQQVYRPKTQAGMIQTLQLLDRLGNVVPLYRLGCNMELEAAKVAYEGMS